jgi:serine/threonine protein kinase/WD40 repeat protein
MNDASVKSNPSLDALVGEVADEFLRRQEQGERPTIDEYVARYPEAAGLLRKVLAALQVLDLSAYQPGAPATGGERERPEPADHVTGTLGDFRLLREVGRGGMGIVYEAEQVSLGRLVALKVLPFAGALDPRALQRFHNEARAAASLHHPHIVPVYAVGQERGVHYYAMQFIDGQSLDAVLGQLRQADKPRHVAADPDATAAALPHGQPVAPPSADTKREPVGQASTLPSPRTGREYYRRLAELGIAAAEALEHAHQLGIIHRDVKPANLMLDDRGQLWVTDFGLAQFQSDARLTMTGDLLGTLRYMSPEQALAQRVVVDQRTDVYSLGATLYELLTLEPVFNGQDRQELLRQIAFEEPTPLRRVQRTIPVELETIVLKALEKNPQDRYATAQELADDLTRYISDEAIRAARPSVLLRARKWFRRHPAVIRSAIAMLVLALFGTALGASLIWVEKDRTEDALIQRDAALAEKTAALKHKQAALDSEREASYDLRLLVAQRDIDDNNIAHARRTLEGCAPGLRRWEWHYLHRLCHQERLELPHSDPAEALAFSPDGRQLVIVRRGGVVIVVDTVTGRTRRLRDDRPSHPYDAVFSPNGRFLAVCGGDVVEVWNTTTWQSTLLHHSGKVLEAIAFRPGTTQLLHCDRDKSCLVDLETGKEIWSGPGGVGWNGSMFQDGKLVRRMNKCRPVFSPDGSQFTLGDNRSECVRNTATGQVTWRWKREGIESRAWAFSADGQHLLLAGKSTIRSLDFHNDKTDQVQEFSGRLIAATPDLSRIATVRSDSTLEVWDRLTPSDPLVLRGVTGSLDHSPPEAAFNDDGAQLATSSLDGTIKIWDTTRPAAMRFIPCEKMAPYSAVFSPVSQTLAVGSLRKVLLFDTDTGKLVRTLDHWSANIRAITYSPNGLFVAAMDVRGEPKVFSLERPSDILDVEAEPHGPSVGFAIAINPAGTMGASAADNAIWLWNPATGKKIRPLEGPTKSIYELAFSPNGSILVGVSFPNQLRQSKLICWDTNTGRRLRAESLVDVFAIVPSVGGVAHHAESNSLAVTGWPETGNCAIKIRRSKGGEIKTLQTENTHYWSLAFTPDGQRLVALARDRLAFWDVPRGKLVLSIPLEIKTDPARLRVLVSPDGWRVAVFDPELGIRLWDARPMWQQTP